MTLETINKKSDLNKKFKEIKNEVNLDDYFMMANIEINKLFPGYAIDFYFNIYIIDKNFNKSLFKKYKIDIKRFGLDDAKLYYFQFISNSMKRKILLNSPDIKISIYDNNITICFLVGSNVIYSYITPSKFYSILKSPDFKNCINYRKILETVKSIIERNSKIIEGYDDEINNLKKNIDKKQRAINKLKNALSDDAKLLLEII